MKTNYNNDLTIKDIGKKVVLNGWVSKIRNFGFLIFLDLRDRFGITQITFKDEKLLKLASTLKNEYVIEVIGIVVERENKNKNIKTGDIEVNATDLKILNTSLQTPIIIDDNENILEETRLKYRYLDLRIPKNQKRLLIRHEIIQAARSTLVKEGFYELETPILGRSTPEGARDYLVPSRIQNGMFYALPQSPQMYKQLFMVAGFEKYFQFTRCFRDEDLRADRQPEFSQIDIECSFIDEKDIQKLSEKIFKNVFKKVLGINLKTPFMKMNYNDAIKKYGSDKPDIRFELLINDYTNFFTKNPISFFNNPEYVGGILASDANLFSNKKIAEITNLVKKNHGETLTFIKKNDNFYSGSIVKNIKTEELKKLNMKNNEILFLVPGKFKDVSNSLGALRLHLGKFLNLIDENEYKFLWINDFPLLEYSAKDNRFYAMHHPFTSAKDFDVLKNNPKDAIAKAYDLVLNGYELGGGSIRIHNMENQDLMFKTLGFNAAEIKAKFGFFVEALSYGTPPHGGIAFGLDRIAMLMTKTDNIRDVIAFPKTQNARDLMTQAPNIVDEIQLKELSIKVVKNET